MPHNYSTSIIPVIQVRNYPYALLNSVHSHYSTQSVVNSGLCKNFQMSSMNSSASTMLPDDCLVMQVLQRRCYPELADLWIALVFMMYCVYATALPEHILHCLDEYFK